MKKLCAIMALGMISLSVSAQSIREKIDKAHKDPANKERAAKADARLIDKRIILDSSKIKSAKSRRQTIKPPSGLIPMAIGTADGAIYHSFEGFYIKSFISFNYLRLLISSCRRANHFFIG